MKICVALTKGRLEKQFLRFLQSLHYDTKPLEHKGRKLRVQTDRFDFIFAKGADAATYVEHGIADLGIVGEDILLEFKPDVYDLIAMPFGECRFAVAGKPAAPVLNQKKKIATKYPNITSAFFREKGESVDIVKLEGSVELAPILGLADAIVDIVETGHTLAENGLVVQEELFSFTARCIANRSSLKIKNSALSPLIQSFRTKEEV